MVQQGQVLKMKTNRADGRTLWAYRYRVGGRGSRRLQCGGFVSERDACEALERALAAVGPRWEARVGAAERRFAALAAASVARAGQALVVSDERRSEFLGPLPLELLPLERERAGELRELGVRKLGERLHEGLRQVRAATGTGSVCTVVEIAPWSRIPEARALLVPRDE